MGEKKELRPELWQHLLQVMIPDTDASCSSWRKSASQQACTTMSDHAWGMTVIIRAHLFCANSQIFSSVSLHKKGKKPKKKKSKQQDEIHFASKSSDKLENHTLCMYCRKLIFL